MDAVVREAVIMSFNTNLDRVRSVRVPDPLPEPVLDASVVMEAGSAIVASNIFADTSPSGSPVSLYGAVRERVTSRKLF